jgi:hypothetical protein
MLVSKQVTGGVGLGYGWQKRWSVFRCTGTEFATRLEPQGLQTIELLVSMLGSNPNSWFHDLG